jgi:hypothetical protein
MKRSPASTDLFSMIEISEASYNLHSSMVLPTASPEKPTKSELLITNGLSLQEIKKKVELLERLIDERSEVDQETLKKLARIKEKIQISDKMEDVIRTKGNYKDCSLSEKYLSQNLLRYFAEDIMKNLEPAKNDVIKIRNPRTSL